VIGDLEHYKGLVEKCSHCALCEAVCPVFQEDMLETHVARTRVDIINQTLYKKTMPVTPRVREIIDRCLVCTSCTQDCGAAVPVHEIIITARAALYESKQKNRLKDYFTRTMMENRGIKGFPALMLATAQALKLAPAGFPKVSLRNFDSLYKGVQAPSGTKRARVAYFTGCATNTMDVETGISAMKVLGHNGIEVVIPEKLTCCGIPALGEGDIATAQRVVRNNIIALGNLEADAIVVDCTSCGMMLRSEALKLLPADDPLLAKAQVISAKVFEVTDYLNTIGLSVEPGRLEASYTYHIPCHRSWTPTLNEAPLQLLSKIPGLRYSAMEDPAKCCGAGGAFFMEYSKLSQGIRRKKLADIESTSAGLLVSQCPGCRSYLSDGLGRAKQAVHPLTMLRRAYRL
jgi:glycolate oxidase iron-sulfur subunit